MAGSALPPARLGCLSPSLHCSEFEHLMSGNRPISAHLAPSCKRSACSGRFLQDKPGSCHPKLIPLTCGRVRNRQEVTGSLQVAGLEPSSLGSAQGPPPRTLGQRCLGPPVSSWGLVPQARAGRGSGVSHLPVRVETLFFL